MPYIMNSLSNDVTVQALGKWFSFTPEQIKLIHEPGIAHFLVTKRGDMGLVEVPEELMERKLENPEEFKAEIETLRKQGIKNRVRRLQSIVHNLEVSLRRDLEMKNIKADPLSFASDGEVAAYKELSSIGSQVRNKLETPADKIRKLKDEMNGSPNISHSGTAPAGSPVNAKTAKS